MFCNSCMWLVPVNGDLLYIISYRITPADHRSALSSYFWYRSISGAMYSGEPHSVAAIVSGAICRAKPYRHNITAANACQQMIPYIHTQLGRLACTWHSCTYEISNFQLPRIIVVLPSYRYVNISTSGVAICIVQQQILWLEIPVYQLVGSQIVQTLHQLPEVVLRQPLVTTLVLAQVLAEITAVAVLYDEVDVFLCVNLLHQPYDVNVVHILHDTDFNFQVVHVLFVALDLVAVDRLDGVKLTCVFVLCQVHGGKRASAQLALYDVVTDHTCLR